ncbi:MAG: aldehyde dehydrogenase family protein [Solirubrobacterales bacterium]
MASARGIYVGGAFVAGGGHDAEVRSPFDARPVAQVGQASWEQIDRALALAVASGAELAGQSAARRRGLCQAISAGIEAQAEELAQAICAEAGKPIDAARVEVRRAAITFSLAAGEVAYFGGANLPGDLDEQAHGTRILTQRRPVGPVVGISPFNFPLNLAAHKIAPALAVGAPLVLKPPPQAPSAALILAEIVQRAGAHPAALAVLPCDNALAEKLALDGRVRLLSFTGSARVGWALKQKVGPAVRVLLELGGNAGVIVAEDADLAWAIDRCAIGAFVYSGQLCISVQRILVHESLYARFLEGLIARARAYAPGDPAASGTVVGPLIDEAAAIRIADWLREARDQGAVIECGGERRGALLSPAVVTHAPATAKICREEVFGPVVVVAPYQDFEQALASLDDSTFGLQAGLFTYDLRRIRRAFDRLDVGGLIVNDAPTFRADHMPYGGAKASGLGREGVRYAMEAMTEWKTLVIANH